MQCKPILTLWPAAADHTREDTKVVNTACCALLSCLSAAESPTMRWSMLAGALQRMGKGAYMSSTATTTLCRK